MGSNPTLSAIDLAGRRLRLRTARSSSASGTRPTLAIRFPIAPRSWLDRDVQRQQLNPLADLIVVPADARSAQLPVCVLIRPWVFSSARPAVTALLVAKKKGHSRGLSRLPWQARSTAVRSTYRRHHHNSIPLRNTSACRLLDSARCNKTRPRLRLDWPMQSARFPMRLIRTAATSGKQALSERGNGRT